VIAKLREYASCLIILLTDPEALHAEALGQDFWRRLLANHVGIRDRSHNSVVPALVKRPPFPVIAPKPCGFCGARVKLSEEHIFADWLAPYLPDIGPAGHTTSQRMHRIPGPKGVAALKMKPLTVKAKRGILQGRRKPVKSSSLKIVCERCNNGWMSRIQDQVKPILLPMLHGRWPTEISRWDRRILAAWATMFTMVIEFADPATQATTFPDREKFRLNPEPPAGWHVWVGLHSGPLWKLGYDATG
jgi:hypothetical protein